VHPFVLTAVVTAGGAPRAWTHGSSDSALATTFLLLIVLGGLAARFLWVTRRSKEDEDGESGSGGGGGPRRPGGPPNPGGDPVWWAEFERDFAAYVRAGSQEGSPTQRLHARAADHTDGPGALYTRHARTPAPVSGFPYPGVGAQRR
jgi:hypothetical protein